MPNDSQESHTDPSTAFRQTGKIAFELTPAAAAKVRAAMEDALDATHLIVEVEIDDEKYCTGFRYQLTVGAAPSQDEFEMSESSGIKLVIERRNLRFLAGTTLDYERRPNGVEGFKFRNPNEKSLATPSGNAHR